MFFIAIPAAIVAYRQLNFNIGWETNWPFYLLIGALVIGGLLQVLAAIVNRNKPEINKERLSDDHEKEYKEELSAVYADVILDWLQKNCSAGCTVNADALTGRLAIPRDRILWGLQHLDSLKLVDKTNLGWVFAPSKCSQIIPKFQRTLFIS
jgi:hypothetical protein